MINRVIEPSCGFVIVSTEEVADYDGEAYLMRHEPTGAELLFMANDDAEKAFAIAFKTLPHDNTGVFHVIEHSTLCGSRKYPVKDPFVHLLKTSMSTFLNAATGQTYTYYPVASTNERDLFNLADVYLDAVFHPALLRDEAIFLQEGWHYEEQGDGLVTTGVVLNEMRGYASPEADLARALKRVLYAGTPYACVSGGEPGAIEQLTYAQFVDTYRRCYRPDNCRITVYGDVDAPRMLAFLDAHLRDALEGGVASEGFGDDPAGNDVATSDAAMNDMRDFALAKAEVGDIVVEGDITPDRCMFQFWSVVGDWHDPDRTIAAMMLADQLFNTDEAPVKRRVLESGVCSQMVGAISPDAFFPTLRVAMLGVQPRSAEACRKALCDAVREALDEGLSRDLLEAGVEHLEFSLKSHDFGSIPDGIMFVQDSLPGWLAFDGRPVGYAQYARYIDFMRGKLGTSYYDELLEAMFFGNDHTACGELVPLGNPTCEGDGETCEGAAPAKAGQHDVAAPDGGGDGQGGLPDDAAAARELAKRAACLLAERDLAMAAAPLDSLPRLTRDDLGAQSDLDAPTLQRIDGTAYLLHHAHSNGIVYVTGVFDVGDLPVAEAPYLALLCAVMDKVSTASFTAEQLEIERKKAFGQFMLDVSIKDSLLGARPSCTVQLHASMLARNIDAGARLVGELLFEADYANLAKLRLTVEQELQALRMALAHGRAALPVLKDHAAASVSAASRLGELASGVGYYRFLEDVLARTADEAELAGLAEHLEALAADVFCRCPELVSFTGTADEFERYRACTAPWRSRRASAPSWRDLATAVGDAVAERAGETASAGGEGLAASDEGVQAEDVRELFTSRDGSGAVRADGATCMGDCGVLPRTDAALALPVDVACNFSVVDVGRIGADGLGAWMIAAQLLNLNYLWQEVRERGGAYGSRMLPQMSGVVTLLSHDDPRVDATFRAFAGAAGWLERLDVSDEDFEGAVIKTVASIDAPKRVESRVYGQLSRYLSGAPADARARMRQAVLACTRDDIAACGRALARAFDSGLARTSAASPAQLQASEIDFEVLDLLHILG